MRASSATRGCCMAAKWLGDPIADAHRKQPCAKCPELLAALRAVRDCLTQPFGDADGAVRHYVQAILVIHEAIAKAEAQ